MIMRVMQLIREMKQIHLRIGALFLLSITLIGYEIAIMRAFSVGSWSNFGSMVISIALLGFGLAGTLLTFIQKRIRKAPDFWLRTVALVYMPAMVLAYIAAQLIPFKPIMIASDATQIFWIAMFYLIYSIPFFIGAVFINIAFVVMGSRIHTLYFWNMTGSGIGGVVILLCMYIFPPDRLVLPLIGLSFFAVLFCYVRYSSGERKLWIEPKHLVLTITVLIVSGVLLLSFGKINVSEFKGVSYARRFPDAKLDYHSYSPAGEMHVYSSSYFHFAPGLSDTASLNLKEMPQNAFKGLYIDGGGPIGIMRELEGFEKDYIDYLPMSAPYLLMERPEVLLVKLGGGTSVFTALHHGAEKVHVVESNPDLVHLMGEVPVFLAYNGHLLADPRVEVISREPRAYASRNRERFDLVEISLIDSVGLSQAEPYPLVENYTYTEEAITDYMGSLNSGGILSLTVWNKLSPPRNVPKLLATVIQSLRKQGVSNPGNRIFTFNLLLSTATVLVKNSDFTSGEIDTLRDFARRMSFEVSYYPGIPPRNKDFQQILKGYEELYAESPASGRENGSGQVSASNRESGPQAGAPLLAGDLYHFSLLWMLGDKTEDFYKNYIFDVRPATDDRPYYTAYMKPRNLPVFLDQLGEVSEEWGYLLLLGTLLISLLAGAVIILVPLAGRWKDLFKGRRGTPGIIVYYACLGIGYMLVEIFLIQRLVFFLAEPIFSVSIVIVSMLVISGLGAITSRRMKGSRAKVIWVAVLAIGLTLLFYIFGLSPLIRALIGLPLLIKALVAVIIIAPAAFFMGMPFPTGLSSLEANRRRLLPWALGMNGALSVTGAVLAKLLSISYGFKVVLVAVILLYLIVGLIYRSNEVPDTA
jgi:hypothetical protein